MLKKLWKNFKGKIKYYTPSSILSNSSKVKKSNIPSYKNTLRKISLFHGLDEKQLDQLLELAEEIIVKQGETIITEGELSRDIFIVQSGAVEVVKKDKLSNNNYRITTLSLGTCFGEMALLEKTPRSATINAIEDSKLIVISFRKLESTLQKEKSTYEILYSNIAKNLSHALSATNQLTVEALTKELESTKKHIEMCKFSIYTLLIVVFYNLSLHLITYLLSDTSLIPEINITLIFLSSFATYMMMKQSGHTPKFYGVTTFNWYKSSIEAVLYSFIIIFGIMSTNWLIDFFFSINIIDLLFNNTKNLLIDNKPRTLTNSIYISILYIFFVPLQEFIFRGGIQGTLQNLLPEKYRIITANFTTSAIFAMSHLHLSIWASAMTFIPSLFWGWMYARQKNLIGVSISHAILGMWIMFL